MSCTWVEGLCLWRPLSFRFLLDPVSLERPKPLLTRDSLDCVVGTKASPRLMHFFSWAANIELGNCTIHPAFIRPRLFHVLVTNHNHLSMIHHSLPRAAAPGAQAQSETMTATQRQEMRSGKRTIFPEHSDTETALPAPLLCLWAHLGTSHRRWRAATITKGRSSQFLWSVTEYLLLALFKVSCLKTSVVAEFIFGCNVTLF